MSGILVPKPMLGRQLRKGRARGLVGYWLLNEGSGNKVFDLSGNGNAGTFAGGVIWTPGKFGWCLDVDGIDGEVIVSDNPSLDIAVSNGITFVAWVKVDDYVNDGGILDKATGTSSGATNYRMFTVAGGRFRVYFGGGTYRTSSGAYPIGEWIHVAGVYDGGKQIYINGKLDNGTTGGSTYATGNAGNLYIGSKYSSIFFNGQIDLPMIYNRALNASEIAAVYLRPFAMFDRMPIELWVGATSVGVPAVGIPILRRRRAG